MFPRALTTVATATSSRRNNVALEEFLPKCSICFTTFSSTSPRDDYAPIQSSKCSHTFCRSCILGSHRVQRHRSHRLACLVCRADGAFYMTNLHVNLELVRVMDALAAVPMPVAVPRPLATMAKGTLADMVQGVTLKQYQGTLHPLAEHGHFFETVQREIEISPYYPSLQRDISWRLKALLLLEGKHPGIIPSITRSGTVMTMTHLRHELRIVWKTGQCPAREKALHSLFNASAFVEALFLEPGAKEKLEKWGLTPPERRWGSRRPRHCAASSGDSTSDSSSSSNDSLFHM